jgi:Family of unknown function (DUF6599)
MKAGMARMLLLSVLFGAAPFALSSLHQPAGRPMGDAALMPADDAITGWKKSGAVRVFGGPDLYGYIDGGAELFLEFGFDRLSLQKYRSGPNEFAVEIYRMADPVAATGIYLMKCGKVTRDPSFAPRHTINRHQLMFVRERYFVTVNNLSGADQMTRELVKFGTLVASRLPADRLPAELSLLPAAGLVPGSERLIRGPFSLQSLYTFGEGDILQLAGRSVGVAGDYRDAAGTTTKIIITYPDAGTAARAFSNLTVNLDRYLKPTSTAPARLTFKDYEDRFGIATVSARRLDITLHLVKPPR